VCLPSLTVLKRLLMGPGELRTYLTHTSRIREKAQERVSLMCVHTYITHKRESIQHPSLTTHISL
jgi:hypothetical protein